MHRASCPPHELIVHGSSHLSIQSRLAATVSVWRWGSLMRCTLDIGCLLWRRPSWEATPACCLFLAWQRCPSPSPPSMATAGINSRFPWSSSSCATTRVLFQPRMCQHITLQSCFVDRRPEILQVRDALSTSRHTTSKCGLLVQLQGLHSLAQVLNSVTMPQFAGAQPDTSKATHRRN